MMPPLTSVNTTPERSALAADADSGVSIGDLFRTLRSRLPLILTCAAVCVLCSVIYLILTKPVYEGAATVRIDPSRAGSLGLTDLTGNATNDGDAGLHTEIAVLKGDGVALRTLQSLSDETFQSLTGVSKSAANLPDRLEALTPAQQDILNNFEGAVDAKQVEGTSLINVTVHATAPRTAADAVNTLIKAYVVQSFTSRDNSVAQLRTWLSAQMATLKNQVDTAQQKLADFQEANNIVGGAGGADGGAGGGNTITDRLRILNQSLAAAQAERIDKESQLRSAANASPTALATLFPNPNLNALQASQGDLETKAAQLSAKFGPKYPPLLEINKQLATIDTEIKNNVNSVHQRLQQQYDASKSNEDMLQKQYDTQTKTAYGLNRNQAEYAVLQGDVTSSRDLYDILRRKMAQASVDADVNGLNTVLVDSSRVPTMPVAPKKALILGASLILGLFAGIVAAFLGEALTDTLRNPNQIEREVGLPVIGLLPRDGAGSLVTLRQPASKNAEAYRNVRNAIMLTLPREHSKKLLVTSSLPGEGMSKVAANLAISLAQAGYRVLAVDTDLRSPSLHQEFGADNTTGLSKVLVDPTQAGKFTQPVKELSTLFFLGAGPSVTFSSERLASESFRGMLQQWESQFDFVVLQSAPLLVVSDGLSLAAWADSVLLVTRYGVTRLKTLTQARNLLRRTDAHVAGVLVDDVPPASMESESYGKVGNAYFA
jgi:succinoglycan biosynthesis transport protein ExoP